MIELDNYKIIEKLGNGVFGTTYKVKIGSKYYALKRQKILDSELIKDIGYDQKISSDMLGSKIWREIYFSKKMSNISEHFMKLYNYKIIYNCSHMQKLPNWIKYPGKKFLDKINKYNSSLISYKNQIF